MRFANMFVMKNAPLDLGRGILSVSAVLVGRISTGHRDSRSTARVTGPRWGTPACRGRASNSRSALAEASTEGERRLCMEDLEADCDFGMGLPDVVE